MNCRWSIGACLENAIQIHQVLTTDGAVRIQRTYGKLIFWCFYFHNMIFSAELES